MDGIDFHPSKKLVLPEIQHLASLSDLVSIGYFHPDVFVSETVSVPIVDRRYAKEVGQVFHKKFYASRNVPASPEESKTVTGKPEHKCIIYLNIACYMNLLRTSLPNLLFSRCQPCFGKKKPVSHILMLSLSLAELSVTNCVLRKKICTNICNLKTYF